MGKGSKRLKMAAEGTTEETEGGRREGVAGGLLEAGWQRGGLDIALGGLGVALLLGQRLVALEHETLREDVVHGALPAHLVVHVLL